MTTPQMMRFTLAELVSCNLVDKVLANVGSRIHLVLTERQVDMPSEKLREACAIISVEDAEGITVAVQKHRTGEIWDRRAPKPIEVASVEEGMAALKGRRGYVIVDEHEPLVPRRAPSLADYIDNEGDFENGMRSIVEHLRASVFANHIEGAALHYEPLNSAMPDKATITGRFSLRALARAFLAGYTGSGIHEERP